MQKFRQTTKSAGFTLIELLIVVAIISLLVAILFPTIVAARLAAINMKSKVMINNVSSAADHYQQDNQAYPGQNNANQLMGTGGSYTGTQVLGAALMGYSFGQINGSPQPTNTYLATQPGDLQTFNGRPNTLSDRFTPIPLPILYYPARIDQMGLNQFVEGDNSPYKNQDGTSITWQVNSVNKTFSDYITNPNLNTGASTPQTTSPWKMGAFIIIGAGKDQKFGTADDLTNFN